MKSHSVAYAGPIIRGIATGFSIGLKWSAKISGVIVLLFTLILVLGATQHMISGSPNPPDVSTYATLVLISCLVALIVGIAPATLLGAATGFFLGLWLNFSPEHRPTFLSLRGFFAASIFIGIAACFALTRSVETVYFAAFSIPFSIYVFGSESISHALEKQIPTVSDSADSIFEETQG